MSDPQYRPVSLPDNDRVCLAVGVQYKAGKSATLDVGYAYLFLRDTGINNNGASPATKGLVSGSYSNSGSILGIQYSQKF